MGLKQTLQADVAAAMRAGDTQRRDVLRGALAEIKQVEIDRQIVLEDDGVVDVLIGQVKQRRETIADAQRAGRDNLIAEAEGEIAVLQIYLPRQLSREELEPIIAGIIAELGITDMKGMGRVMGQAMARLKGQAEGNQVSLVVRDQLQRL